MTNANQQGSTEPASEDTAVVNKTALMVIIGMLIIPAILKVVFF